MITNENIIRIVNEKCQGKCSVTCYPSKKTTSLYFRIFNDTIDCWFRVADHKSRTRIKSIIISERTKGIDIERYVKNRIDFLGVLTLDSLLGIARCRLPRLEIPAYAQ